MKRFLVLGDIHIGDYSRYNGVVNRLGQFTTLANRLIELDADEVIIAGDFLLNCVMKPKVMHVVKDFIEKLCNRFENVYYILGNHDLDVKLIRFSGEDSFVTLFSSINNFHYMHDKHLKVEDTDIYFMDWTRASTVPLKDTCDIFISHINLMPRFGQEVDNSKFKLGIFGDYHARFQVKNMITTGTPIQHYVSDPTEPAVLRLDINGNVFTTAYTPIENEKYKFLKIYKEDDFPRAPGALDVKVPNKVKNKKIEDDYAKLKVSLDSKLDETLTEAGLIDIHKEVLSINGDVEPLDIDFELVELTAKNFRSIENLKVTFDNGKLVFLQGANGSGKSSFIRVLTTALFGDRHIKLHTRKGQNYCEVGIKLRYQGRVHWIVRAQGYLYYQIDDKPQDANNMTALQDHISKNLPFIPYIRDFIIGSHSTFFSNCNRVALFSRLFGLDRYMMYSQIANQLKVKYEASRNEKNNKINLNKNSIETYKTVIATEESKLVGSTESLTESELQSYITTSESNYNSYKYLETEINNLNIKLMNFGDLGVKTIETLQSEMDELKSEKLKIESSIRDISTLSDINRQIKIYEDMIVGSTHYETCLSCGSAVKFDMSDPKIKESLESLKSKKSELDAGLEGVDLIELNNRVTFINSEITIKSNLCESIRKKNSINSDLTESKTKMNSLISSIGSIDELKNSIDHYKERLNNLRINLKSLETINTYKNSVSNLESENEGLSNEVSNLDSTILKYNRYLELFSLGNFEGITYKTLELITESISDEDITFTTNKELASGKTQFRMSCQMNVDGNNIDFDELSDGQQAFVSLKILSKLSNCIPKVGLVILDEPLKHVDEGNINQCIDLLKNINSNSIILSSHSPSFNYADRVISFSLVDGVTCVEEAIDG